MGNQQIGTLAPAIGVGVIVIRNTELTESGDKEILLVRRSKEPDAGSWSIPGGHLRWGETLAQGAEREIREETGVEINLIGQVGTYDAIIRDHTGGTSMHFVLVNFLAAWRAGTAIAASDAAAILWIAPRQLAQLNMNAQTRHSIKTGLAMWDDAQRASPNRPPGPQES